MKITFVIIFLLVSIQSFALQPDDTNPFKPSMKYGKPSQEELDMSVYAADTTAAAVVLYSKTDARYDIVNNDFQVVYNYEVKIKVLKPEGTSYANIDIPFYSNETNSTMKEKVGQIDASAYNLEGGKMVRTKMTRDLIFEERLNKKYKQIKFSIPAVRQGTVFEFKFQLTSDFYYDIKQWDAQKDIPVIYTEYDTTIPEYFKFSIDMRGGHFLSPKDESRTMSYNLQLEHGQSQIINCSGRHLQFTGQQLPAIRSDSYVWCPDDYLSGVRFELKGIEFPGSLYKSFTHTWEDIDKLLLEDEDFGSLLKMRNPYREEMASLGLDKYPDCQTKIAAIFTFLKKKISWNNQYGLYGSEIKKAIKNGTGTNADINFILMSMLRDAQIPCYPVVMSRKSLGILPYTHPSIQKLNTFVVGIADTDSTFVFLDGSVNNGYINTIPPVLMVNRARLIRNAGEDNWIDLSNIGKDLIRSFVNVTVQPNGVITGNRQTKYMGQYAADLRKRYRAAKDSTEFINKLETMENIKVNIFHTKAIQDFTPEVLEDFNFEKQAITNDKHIYVNPLIFLHVSKCPFTQAERSLPLEMQYPEQLTLIVSLTIPEGYAIDEIPKSMNIKTEDNKGYCRYHIKQQENQVILNYTFAFKNLLHSPEEYKGVKSFWEMVTEKNNETLVFKKL